MIDAQLVVVDRDTDAYRFRHALIGEVVYDELLPPNVNGCTAASPTRSATRRPTSSARADRASELAFHLDRAGDHAAAFVALLLAADAAETVAPAAALRHLERAWSSGTPPASPAGTADRGDRLWQAAELASGTVGNERAADIAREAFQYGAPPRGVAWGHERLGRYLWGAGQLEESAAEFAMAATSLPGTRGQKRRQCSPGWRRPSSCSAATTPPKREPERVFEMLTTPHEDPLAWSMAQRVLGIVIDHGGDPVRGVELCVEAVDAAPTAQTRAFAVLYLGVALLDAGRYQDAVNEMLDAAAEARLTGLDRSFGGYLDALTAEGLLRLGRWSEAAQVLNTSEGSEAFPLGEIRLALVGAVLAAGRGDGDRARALLASGRGATRRSFSQVVPRSSGREVSLALRDWAEAAAIGERAVARGPTALWQARFVMYGVVAEVELALDARADASRSMPTPPRRAFAGESNSARRADAHRGERRRSILQRISPTRMPRSPGSASPIPRPGPTPLGTGHDLADPYWLATARVREAEAAAAAGATARAAEALQEAHKLAVRLGARLCWRKSTPCRDGPGSASNRRSRPRWTTARSIVSASRLGRPRCFPSSRQAKQTDRSARRCSCPRRPRASTSRTSFASSESAAESTPPQSPNASAPPDALRRVI